MSSFNQLSDMELIDLAKAGEEAAFSQLYQRYWNVLFLHAHRMLTNEEEAKDLVQTLFYNLFVNLPRLTLKTSFASYVYGSIKNMVLDHIKHQDVVQRYLDSFNNFIDSGTCVTDHEVRRRELEYLVEEGVSSMPANMQQIFRLSRMEQLTHKEIAQKLEISEHTVKSQINKALKILRSKLGMSILLFFIKHNDF